MATQKPAIPPGTATHLLFILRSSLNESFDNFDDFLITVFTGCFEPTVVAVFAFVGVKTVLHHERKIAAVIDVRVREDYRVELLRVEGHRLPVPETEVLEALIESALYEPGALPVCQMEF